MPESLELLVDVGHIAIFLDVATSTSFISFGAFAAFTLVNASAGTDIQTNLAAIDRFAVEAARDGAALVAFPEYATYEKKTVDATFPEVAEPLDGPVCQELANTARHHRIALVAGVVEVSREPGKAYNTLVAFGPDGGRLAFYRKIHLFDAQGFGESTFIKPGPSISPVVFESGGACFGLMTCYDLRFPELARSLADAGAQVLLVCSSWVSQCAGGQLRGRTV